MTPGQEADLEVARHLARAGVPLFLAWPDLAAPTGYRLPVGWQHAAPDPTVVDHWRPGLALCAVMGCAVDLVDVDPRSGGDLGALYLGAAALGMAETPSWGTHVFVPPLGLPSLDGVLPGVDYKGGAPDGSGRGFAFIAPTVRTSKVDGQPRTYRWAQFPKLRPPPGPTRPHDPNLAALRQRILDRRAARAPGQARRIPRSAARAEWDRAVAALSADVADWAARGWGGAAHAGLLRHSTHLARLSPDHAEAGYRAAFAAAGVEPDEADLDKLTSAVDAAIPDEVVPDEECAPQELFWTGVAVTEPPKAATPADPLGRAERGPFAFLTEDEAAAIPLPDPLVAGLLFLSSKARLFGESTRGKTWVVLDLAAHVSLGLPWLGREVKQGPVLYVAAEGAPSFAPRMRTWAAAHGGRRSGVRMWPEPVPIGGPSWAQFCARVAEEGFVLVIGDTQSAMTAGVDEDNNSQAAQVHDALGELVRASGGCYLGVHHVGWADQGRPRGASGMFGAMDTELRLAESRHGLVLVTEKQRYAEKAPPVALRLVAEYDGLVVHPPAGEAGALLVADDHDVRVAAELARLRDYADRGGSIGAGGYRTVLRVLNEELRRSGDEPVTEAVARDVAHAYKRSVGMLP